MALEEIVQSMIEDGRSEEEIASVISEHGNIEKIDNKKVFESPSEEIEEVKTTKSEGSTKVPALEEPAIEASVDEIKVTDEVKVTDLTNENEKKKRRFKDKVKSILGPMNVSTELQDNVVRYKGLIESIDIDDIAESSKKTTANSYFQINQIKKRQGFDLSHLSDEFIKEAGFERQIPFKTVFFDYYKNEQGFTKKQTKKLWKEYEQYEETNTLPDNDFINNEISERVNKEKGKVTNDFFKGLNGFEISEIKKYFREVENKSTLSIDFNPLVPEKEGGDGQFEFIVTNIESRIAQLQNQYDTFEEKGFGSSSTYMKGSIKEELDGLKQEIELFKNRKFKDLKLIPQIFEATNYGGDAVGNINNGRSNQETSIYRVDFPEVEINVDKPIVISKAQANLNIVKDIFSQTISTDPLMLEIMGESYWTKTIENFEKFVEEKGYILRKRGYNETGSNLSRGSDKYYEQLIRFIGEDKTKAYKNYLNWVAKKSEADNYVDPQGWMQFGTFDINEEHAPTNWFGIKVFEEKYNADRVHLFNEKLTPTELLDYQKAMFNVAGLNLYNEEEQERIKDEDAYRKLTGKYLLQPTTYKGVYYEPRINMNPENRKSVEADLRARHSFYKPFAELSSYDINRVTNYTTRKLNKHIKDAFKRIEQIEKVAEKEMEKYLSSVPKELTDRLGELMDMLASYPTAPTTKEDIKKYNDIILEAQAIEEAMEETGINDLHKRLKYLKNLLEVEIETLVEICEITNKQEPIRRIAGTNYNDWDLAIHNIESQVLYPLNMLVRDVLLLDRTQQITKHNNLGTRLDIDGNLVHAFRPSNTFNVDFDNTTFRGSFFSNLFTWDTRIQSRFWADNAGTISIIGASMLSGGSTASWAIPFFAMGYGNEVFKLENRRNEAKKYIDFYKTAYNLAETEEDKFYYGGLLNDATRMSNLSEFDIYASGIYKGFTEVLTEYTLGFGRFLRASRRFNTRRLSGGVGIGNLVSFGVINTMSNVSQEVLVEILHNGWDKIYLGDDISLFKGLDERRWWDNTVWTTLVIQGPGTVRQSLNVFNDAVSTQKSRAKQRKLAKELHDLLQTKNEIMEDESGSRLAELEEINKRISEVLEESNMINFMNLSELDELTMEEMKEVFSIQRQIDERVSRLSSMAEAFGPDKKLRDKLVQEITELQNKKDKILNKESDKTIEDTKDAANPGVAAYNWGLTKFYNRAIKAMAEQDKDLNYYELDYKIVHLGKFDKDGDKIYELTEKDKAAIRKRFPKDANQIIEAIQKSTATNIGNNIYVFTNNQLNIINKEGSEILSPAFRRIQAAYASAAALHEYIHYYLFKKGLVTYEYDFDVTETEEGMEAVEGVESTSLEAGKIEKKRILNESLRESLEELDRYLQEKLTNEEMKLVRNRIALYKKENDNQDDYEEFVTLLSDLLATGYITKTDINAMFHVRSFFQGLAEFVGLDYGFGDLFKRPEDIVTYLESLQRKINAGKLKVISSTGEEVEADAVSSIMENLASEVDAIWAKDGLNGTVDIISLYGGVYNYDTGAFDVIPNSMLDRAIRRYQGFPSFDYNELANAFVTEKRGLMEMITKEYNAKFKKQKDSKTTEKEATLSMFLNKFWPERIKQIAVDVLKQEFEPVITEKTTKMIDEDGNMDFDFFIDNQIDLQLATVLGVEERIKEKIKEAVEKTFGTKLPAVTSLKFKTVVNDAVRAELNGVIRELMGGRSAAKFKAFLESNYTDKDGNVIEVWKAIYDAIPQSILNKSFQAFIEPVLDEQGRQVRPDNNRLFKRKDITKEEFLDFFFGENVGRSTQGTRKTGLINALAVTLSRHYVIDHLEDSKNLEKTENINELQGHQKVDNYLARVTEALDLNPENKLSIMELTPGVIDEVSKLRDFVSENGETKGSDMAPLLDKYLDEEVDDKFKDFMEDIIDNVKNKFENFGVITMSELAKAIDSKYGQNIGFEFFDSWKQFLRDITDGKVKEMDLTTKEGEEKFFDLMGEFSSTMDPRFLELKSVIAFFSVPGNRFKGFSSGQKNYSRAFVLDKLVRNSEVNDFVRYNEKTKKFEIIEDGKLKGGLTDSEQKAIEEMVIAWNKDMNIDHDSSVERAKLADKINTKFNLNERRVDVEFTRDYMYGKLNDFVNQYPEGSIERLEAISFAVKILQNQTSSTHGISRAGAFLSSFTLDFSTTEKNPFRWEHNIQLLNFNANVLKSIIDGKFNEKYETLSSKYTQTLLDKDAQVFLDGKKMPTAEFKAKYGIDYAEIEKYRGNTAGAPGFVIGMESEAMFIVALGNASRTVDLKTKLTMDRLIYNKINTKRAVDYLDGIAERIRLNTPVTRNSEIVFNPTNESKIFSNKFNTDLFNDIISSLVIGEDATEKIDLLANSIRTQNAKDIKDYKVINKVTENNKIKNEEQDKIDAVVKMSLAGEFNGASLFDFDGTVGESDNVVVATKDGKTRTLDGVQWAEDGLRLIKEGWKMDFSDFNNVTNGELGPLWPKLINQLIKYGPSNTYILTARAPEVQKALFDFINGEIDKYNEENGTNVPHMLRNNIIGLGDSTGKAKADWIKDNLILNGFNDIYFVDDIIENVDAVQDMYNEFPEGTIKDGGKSIIVKEEQLGEDDIDYGKYSLSESFNIIIEESTGIEAKKRYSDVQATLQGKRKWWNKLNILADPGAEDFKGLLYSLLSPGKEGERQMDWFKKNLIDPYDKGVAEMEKERVRLLQNYKEIIKGLPKIRKKLKSKIKREDGKDSYLTLNQAVRVWIWTKNGIDMTAMGLSKRDLDLCLKTIESDPEFKTFADALRNISSEYNEPSQTWITGSISSDIKNMSDRISREKHLEIFIKNKKEIFSKDNMNKLRVTQGDDYVEFLEEMLDRMENGNRNVQGNTISRTEREFNEWVNNSVGAIMFLNMRSAVLQLLSTTNFIDMGYNHPLKAAKAVTTKEYWINFLKIWNSDWLKSRAEKGGRTINEEELIEAITGSKNPISSFIALCLEKGFTPTSIADRLAITFGGASYLTNGVKHYMDILKNEETMREIMGDGVYTTEEIEKAAFDLAFLDLQQKSNESQQSSDPRFISSIQAGGLGRVLFAFKNTPMQYTRLMKRSMQDLLKGRGNSAQHIAKIAYYGAIQNFIFSALQTALFAALDQGDDEWDKKSDRVIQQMIDSILVGLGLKGAIIVTVKNGILTYLDQDARGWNADHTYTILQFANFSPTIGSKLRKIYSSIKGEQLNEDVIAEMDLWDPRNPAWASVANLIEAFTNLPAARANNIINSLLAISADENEFMDNLMLVMGWNAWDLGIETESKKVKKELKSKKEKSKEKEKEKKKQEKVQSIVNKEIEEHKEEIKTKPTSKKESYKCAQVNKKGQRCKIEVSFPGDKCTYHEEVPIRKDGKKTQCKKIKSDGKRCGNQTMSTSGLCPIHD